MIGLQRTLFIILISQILWINVALPGYPIPTTSGNPTAGGNPTIATKCVVDPLGNMQYKFSSGYVWSSPFSSLDYCNSQCSRLNLKEAGVELANKCFCAGSVTSTVLTPSTSCDNYCLDNSTCGGHLKGVLSTFTSTSSSSSGPSVKLYINSDPKYVKAQSPMNITVNLSNSALLYWVDWGDGADMEFAGNNHSYEIAGMYQIQVYLDVDSTIVDRKTIWVNEAPLFSINCTNVTSIGNPFNCSVQLKRMGYDYQLNYTISNSTSAKSFVGLLPSSVITVVGSTLRIGKTQSWAFSSSNYVILANSYTQSLQGCLARVRSRIYVGGIIEIYAVLPSCSSGSYCGLLGACKPTCPASSSPQTCPTSSSLCPLFSSCNATTCSNTTAASTASPNFVRFASVTAPTGSFDFHFPCNISIPDGAIALALGCQSPSCGAAQIYANNVTTQLVTPDSKYTILTKTTDPLNVRLSIQIVVQSHPFMDVNPNVPCDAPAPLPVSAVPKPFTAETANYLINGTLTLKYMILSNSASYNMTKSIPLLCQQDIIAPTFPLVVWMAYGAPYPFQLNFVQGSPIFTVINVDGKLQYDYYDNAILGYNLNVSLSYAKAGQYFLTGNSSNLLGNVTYSSIIHVVPPVTNNWTVKTNCPCYNLDNTIFITASLAKYTTAPWNATFSIYATDTASGTNTTLVASNFTDFGTFNVTSTTPLLASFFATIANAGTYKITLLISNEVSSTSINTTALILEGLRDVSADLYMDLAGRMSPGLGPDSNAFLANFTTYFNLKCRTGNSSNWKVTIIDRMQGTSQEIISGSPSPILSKVFPKPKGDYDVYALIFWAYNAFQGWVPSSVTNPYIIVIVFKIDGYKLTPTSLKYTRPGELFSVNATLGMFTPLTCIIIYWGDGTPPEAYGSQEQCLTQDPLIPFKNAVMPPITLTHVYGAEGTYQIISKAYDSNSLFGDSLPTLIADIACDQPVVSITNGTNVFSKAPSNMKSFQVRIQGNAQYTCNKTNMPVTRFWNISQVNETTGIPIKDIIIDGNPNVPSWNNSQLTVPPLFLDYGLYKFTYNFRIFASALFILNASDFTYVLITKTPLSATMLAGGSSWISRGFGQLLILNSSLSLDPDDPNQNIPFNVTWWCGQISPQLGTLTEPVGNASYPIFNPQSIPPPLDAANKKLTGGGCFGVGDGSLVNPGSVFSLNCATLVNPSAVYQIIMKIAKDTRIAYATLKVSVTPFAPPTVQIQCDKSICYPTASGFVVNPGVRVPLVGICSTDCPASPTYNWTVTTGTGDNVSTKAPCESLPPPANDPNYVCEKAFLTPTNTSSFTMSASFFQLCNPDVNTFIIRFSMRNSLDPNAPLGFTEMVVHRNKPPVGGTVRATVTNGTALLTLYPVLSTGWEDPEGVGINYCSFYIKYNSSGIPVKSTLATTNQIETDLILPVGTFELYCDVVDLLQGTTTLYLGILTAVLPTQDQVKAYDVSNKISQLSSQGDQATLAMVLAAQSSIRDNAPWLSLNPNSTGNLTNSELVSRVTDIANQNNQQLKVVQNTMDFATLAQLEVGSNVVQQSVVGIFNNILGALTVDMDTRDTALNLLEIMASKLPLVTGAAPADMKNFACKCMDAFSALITGINQVIKSGNSTMVPPTDQSSAVNWDYDSDIGFDIGTSVPASFYDQLKQNVLATTIAKSQSQIERIYSTLRVIAGVIQGKCLPGEIIECQSEYGSTLITGKLAEQQLQSGYKLSASNNLNARVTLPVGFCPSRYLVPNSGCQKNIGFTMVVWPCITRIYPVSNSYISNTSRVVDMEVNLNGVIINVTNETLPIVIDIPLLDLNVVNSLDVNPSDSINPHQPLVYHTFLIDSINSGYTITIKSDESLPSNLIFLIDHERIPTVTKYIKAILLKDFSYNSNSSSYSYFISSSENQNRTGRFFVGVGLLNGVSPINANSLLQKSNFLATFAQQYYFSVFVSGCYFFDNINQQWSATGLSLLKASPNLITCSSKHLTSFGSGFNSVANTLNFEYIFAHTGFLDNLTIYITLITIFCLYIITMLWAYCMDKKDLVRAGVIPLSDNKIEDKYLYEVTFRTGPDEEATTTSNIWFIASGDFGETEVRQLPTANENLYRRYMVNSFVMATPKPLGHINFLRVFHDNSGEPPLDTWQLQMVVFRDLQTNEKSIFDINEWLALNRDEGKVDKIFISSEGEGGRQFGDNMYIETNRIANEDNMYMSMFLKPAGSRFSRKERATVCAVYLFLSMMLGVLFYDTQADSPRNGYFEYGLLTISSEQLIVGACILVVAYTISLFLTFVFKRARPRKLKSCRALNAIRQQKKAQSDGENDVFEDKHDTNDTDSQNNEKPKNISPVKCIPWWTRVLAWIAALAIIGISLFIVWSYGIMWGEIKTAKWLSTFLTGFLISILVTQWLKIFILAAVSSAFGTKDLTVEDIDCDEELPELKPEEEWDLLTFMDPSVRKKVHRVEGVDSEDKNVAALKLRLMTEREIHFVLREIMAYLFFLVIIYILINGRTDYNALLLQEHLTDTFVNGVYENSTTLADAFTTDDWWNWAQNGILQQLRAQRNYNDQPPYGLKGFMNDQANRIMGYAIIRQIRTARYNCAVPSPLNQVIKHCSGVRSPSNEETEDFCAGWRKNATQPGDCQFDEFKYKNASELETFPYAGNLGTYSGGGYVIRLTGAQDSLLARLDLLHQNYWIDQNTRAVFLEFSIYNANVNLFSTCLVSTEFSEDGGIVLKWRFEPVKLIKDPGFKGSLLTFAEVAFVIITALVTLREMWNFKKQKCQYFDSYWNLLEICLIWVSFTAIGLYFYRFMLTQAALQVISDTSGNGYLRMDAAVLVDQYYLWTLAFIVFFSTLKLIKLLQFNKRMNELALTIKSCWDELKIFVIAFLIVFFAFACLFFFMFQGKLLEFSEIVSSTATSFQMMLGKFDFGAMNTANPLSPLLFFVFSLVTAMILLNLMVSIILISFKQVKLDLEKQDNRLNVIDHVWTSFRVFIRKENEKSVRVTPIFTDRKEDDEKTQATPSDKDSEALPNKINQLMKYINDVYFDSRLDLTDLEAKTGIMKDPSISSHHPTKEPFKYNRRRIFNSDE